MSSLIEAILNCLTGTESPAATAAATAVLEKQPLIYPRHPRTAEEVASDVVHALVHAEKSGAHLKRTLDDVVSSHGWTEKVAEWVLAKLEAALDEAEKLQGPVKEAYNQACEAALAVEGFVKEHPIFTTVIALGVLVVIAPWVLEVLGFAELGPVEGMLPLCASQTSSVWVQC